MTEIRPIPDFPGYYAGDDGLVYRMLMPTMDGAGYSQVLQVGKRPVKRRLGWLIARAWVDGYTPDAKTRPVNGDWCNTRPDNLRWQRKGEWVERRHDYDQKQADARVRAAMEADPSDPRHGTRTGYRYGCRCERCRAMGPVVNRINQTKKLLREVQDGDCR